MKREILQSKNLKSFSIVEIILATGIFSLLVVGLAGSVAYGINLQSEANEVSKANFLLEEAVEAIYSIKDDSYLNLVDGNHGIGLSGGKWVLTGAQDITDNYTRAVSIATINAETKGITASVSWEKSPGNIRTISTALRLTDWERTILPPALDWATPQTIGTTSTNNGGSGIAVKVVGDYAYIIKGGAANFQVFNIATTPTLVGTTNLPGTPRDIAIMGNYAYVSSTDNSAEISIVNITNPASPTIAGSYNAPGNTDATGIYAVNNRVYLTRGTSSDPEFYVLDATNPTALTLTGSLNIATGPGKLVISGNYAYAASTANNAELNVINITNPASPTFVAGLDLPGNQDGLAIDVYQSTVLLSRSSSLMYAINITNPAAPTSVGTYNPGGGVSINAIDVHPTQNLGFLATTNSASEFQVVDLTNLSAISLYSSVNLSTRDNSLSYSDVYDTVVNLTNAVSNNIVVIGPS
jgi:hypothetical protein